MENIGGDANDTTYRYRMPIIQIKGEGRGNGVKTVLPNVYDVCDALHRDPKCLHLIVFFKY